MQITSDLILLLLLINRGRRKHNEMLDNIICVDEKRAKKSEVNMWASQTSCQAFCLRFLFSCGTQNISSSFFF